MLRAEDSCTLCEKLTIIVESDWPIKSLGELPNTYDPHTKHYVWRYHEIMGYALIPRSFQAATGQIDLYLCIDEDDLDDIDVYGYADRFLREHIMPKWKRCKGIQLLQPTLSSPENIECRRLRHAELEGR